MKPAYPVPGVRRVPCELLASRVSLPARPQRVISLVAGFTETLWAMGLSERVLGVSSYCSRYVDIRDRLVVGDYLHVDEAALARVRPDLVLLTAGVQLGVARRLAAAGWPVMVLPVPDSYPAILANIRRIGALMGEMTRARELTDGLEREVFGLRASAPGRRPRVYTELWFGRHPRVAGGHSFVHDLIDLAGGENVAGALPEGYARLDLASAAAAKPDVVVVFWEEDDHPLDVRRLLAERGWVGQWPFRVIEAGIQRGRNLIHDGPSWLTTAQWLRDELVAATVPNPDGKLSNRSA